MSYTIEQLDCAVTTAVRRARQKWQEESAPRWQPIETAPRSGIAVLLWQPWKSGRDCTFIGHYANGWVDRNYEEFAPEPTHWMPLPEGPAPQHGAEPQK